MSEPPCLPGLANRGRDRYFSMLQALHIVYGGQQQRFYCITRFHGVRLGVALQRQADALKLLPDLRVGRSHLLYGKGLLRI